MARRPSSDAFRPRHCARDIWAEWARSAHLVILLIMAATLLLVSLPPAFAQEPKQLRGVALVIGNGKYEHVAPLANPEADARAVEDLLNDLGFDTDVATDRDARRLARDLDGFADDAEGADVAVVYYSGHGIEAGGENFLVPVDADPAGLATAGDTLVSVTALVEKLQAKVPVVIVLLDACRTSPFPAGATIALKPGQPAVPVTTAGLGLTRGVTVFRNAGKSDGNVGTVIAFAAEPGKVALDGDPGSNSPYAAAVLRHLGAMPGEEFGTVMRMVAEEVYLKTGGRQRPWINESMRRLLYFGQRPAGPGAEEGDILTERRQLLITIAALPEAGRARVEQVAARQGVPMDALYGLLRALGQNVPQDPAELEKLLTRQAERVSEMLAQRAAITATDPEIVRLSSLIDSALADGALETATKLSDRAKARAGQLSASLDDTEAAIRARRIEIAEVFAQSAGVRALAFDFTAAAADYGRAFAEVDGRDARLAFIYKSSQASAIAEYGNVRGDTGSLTEAVEAARAAQVLSRPMTDPILVGGAHHSLGIALATLGGRTNNPKLLEEAIVEFQASRALVDRVAQPKLWASATVNLAQALRFLGDVESSEERYQQAAATFREAIAGIDRSVTPIEWAILHDGLGVSLQRLGEMRNDRDLMIEAVTAHREALHVFTREETPMQWATNMFSLGNAYATLGAAGDVTFSLEAVPALESALTVLTEEKVPNFWATAQNSLGIALRNLSSHQQGQQAIDTLERSVRAYEAALRVHTREHSPLDWGRSQNNRANALKVLANRRNDPQALREAIAGYDRALEIDTRAADPAGFASTSSSQAGALVALGQLTSDAAAFERAISLYRVVGELETRQSRPLAFGQNRRWLGDALHKLADIRATIATHEEANAVLREALDVLPPGRDRMEVTFELGLSTIHIGQLSANRKLVVDGRALIAAARDDFAKAGNKTRSDLIGQFVTGADNVLTTMK